MERILYRKGKGGIDFSYNVLEAKNFLNVFLEGRNV